jgi:hypothetical protein
MSGATAERSQPEELMAKLDAGDMVVIPAVDPSRDLPQAHRRVPFRLGGDLFAAVRSVIGTTKRRGIDAYQAAEAARVPETIRNTLQGQTALAPG